MAEPCATILQRSVVTLTHGKSFELAITAQPGLAHILVLLERSVVTLCLPVKRHGHHGFLHVPVKEINLTGLDKSCWRLKGWFESESVTIELKRWFESESVVNV